MLFSIILAGAVLFSSAVAEARGVKGSCYYYDPIPKQYDYPYKGPKHIQVVPDLVHCGLSWWQNGVCMIQVHPENKKQNIRHEEAHCNGWDAHTLP